MKVERVATLRKEGRLPVCIETVYNWFKEKRHPELIVKIENRLYWDFDKWEKIVRVQQAKQLREAKETPEPERKLINL